MIKRNKGTLLLTTAVMLLPIVVGLLLWKRLPEQMPMHWNAAGEVDGWGNRAMVVFAFPLFVLAIHWLCVLITSMDPKNKEMKGKPITLVLWICPFVSLLVNTLVYTKALGCDLSVEVIMPMVLGLMFVVTGNLLPKCKQNYTIGIKVPWALQDEENWNKTHRFAGKLWVIGGAIIVATSVFGNFIIFIGITLLMCIVPTVYSWLYYRKHS